jgi:pimeloyl-ACP methyl ester carboxylesterase
MGDYDVEHSHGMHVVHDGPRQAPPLLLIHGSGASGASWGPVAGALAGHHHVIRVDLPGCGQSPPAPSYDVPEQAGRVAVLLDDLGLRHLTVAGHSSGGYVATALAEQRPDLVGSLALISTGPSLDALLPQPFILRALLAPPLGPLLWPRRPVDIPRDAVADLKNITYRAFRNVLRCNAAYVYDAYGRHQRGCRFGVESGRRLADQGVLCAASWCGWLGCRLLCRERVVARSLASVPPGSAPAKPLPTWRARGRPPWPG